MIVADQRVRIGEIFAVFREKSSIGVYVNLKVSQVQQP